MSKFTAIIIDKLKQAYGRGLDKHEKDIVCSVLNSNNFGQVIINARPDEIKNVGIILFSIKKYEGGVTSVLRLGTGLAKLGYNVTYVIYGNLSEKELLANAKFNLPSFSGEIKKASDCSNKDFDVVVATSWRTVYKLNDYLAYKMYFVQDFEPYFFKLNERYLLAKLTYELGMHIVSLGQWNINQIRKECGSTPSKLDYIDFPYEKSEYNCTEKRDYNNYLGKKKYKIAVYIKEDGKRIPNIVQYILIQATRDLRNYGIELEINFFGLNAKYSTAVGKNLGKLSKSELAKLYRESDFGMVASMTNISLVPYEMIATGLPIFEFSDGSFTDFFNDKCALLINYDYRVFVDKFIEAVSNPEMLIEMIDEANIIMKNLSWEKSCKQFASYMEGNEYTDEK